MRELACVKALPQIRHWQGFSPGERRGELTQLSSQTQQPPNPTHAYSQWGATPSSCPTHGHRGSGLEILGALLLQAFPKLVERGSSLDP